MNNSSPLIPQGTLLDQKNKGRARVRLAVFFVLAIHVIGLMALLMQGCKRDTGTETTDATTNTLATPTFDPTNAPIVETPLANTNILAPQPPVDTSPVAPAATEYTVLRGDSFYIIAKKFNVSMQAIQAANPGVDPKKLQPGQKINIPPAAPAGSTVPNVGVATPAEGTYKVKSGDTLSKIATEHHTTVKAIRAANNLTTDRIKVGDVLKIPKSSAPATPPATAPTTTSPADGVPTPTPGPGTAPPPAR